MDQFVCTQCNQGFENKGVYDRHMAGSHPAVELTPADLEKAMRSVDFPKSKADLVAFCTRQETMEMAVVNALEALPDRVYRSAAEVVSAFKAAMPAKQQRQQPARHA
jgi:hypothetical protein